MIANTERGRDIKQEEDDFVNKRTARSERFGTATVAKKIMKIGGRFLWMR